MVLAFSALITASVWIGDSWWQLLLAPLVALVVTQVAFLGHDAAHQQVFSSPRWNEVAARVLAAGLAGLSYGWWLGKHNVHHAAPNQRGRDTDIESKVLAFYPEAVEGKSRWHVWLLRHQGFWLLPLLLLEGYNLHVHSLNALVRRGRVKRRWVDVALMLVRWGTYLTLACLLMSPGKAAAFIAVDVACLGVFLGGAFVPNHTGMPVLQRGAKLDFLHRQVLSSRNVRGGHLVQPMVREHCARHGIAYTETSFVGAYASVIAYLNTVGLVARRQNSGSAA